MKKNLRLLTFVICLGAFQTVFSQTKSPGGIEKIATLRPEEKKHSFEGQFLTVNNSTEVMTITGHASFRTDQFETVDAEKIVFDQKAGKLVIYGCKSFAIDGKVVVKDNKAKVTTVEYTLGEDTVYML